METPKKSGGKKASKKPIRVKTVFTTPFPLNWSPLPQNDMHFILTTLKDKLISLGLEKKEVKVFRPWRKRKTGPDTLSTDMDSNKMADSPKGGWTDVTVRRQLALGINEVTKALERNQLKLVLVCKSVKPKHMTSHLIALSASRGVPACQVPRLSESVAEPLGLKSVLALGFRNRAGRDKAEAFADAVEAIIPKVPSLDVPWLQSTATRIKLLHNDTTKKKGEQRAGQKRKLEPESERCTLQPFKVKKIVANPAKIKRKRKKKQAK
ncbi:ribonuclease P protein subunit p38 [Syngnathus acus]|uniref:ribonuclease P protein subunit p38 n=1 Tax=Syngnathus acus TaxID=161584 RepID=UPI001885EB4A|nr:ribonuclease P protein subunit p38 [Syngnathus acus]XP_037130478.1 ribonuclease P protein subunit p38 [Syngnathus acus]XP_037130479.1 ribonuclease P protein subunit p38 [Syngnathus acus]